MLYGFVIMSGILTLLWKSEVGIYALTLLLPLQTTRYHLHAFPLGANMVDLLIICVFIGSFIRRLPPLRGSAIVMKFLVLLGAFYYLSLWRGAFYLGGSMPLWFNDERLVDYKNFIVMFVLALAVTMVIRTRRQIAIILALTCVTALAVDYSYLKSSAGREFNHYSEETRDAGPLGYAGENGLACYAVEITCCLLPFLAVPRHWMMKFALILVVAANICTILYSYSREAYLALICVLLFLAVVKLRWLLILLIALTLAWQVVLPVAVQERMAMTYSKSSSGETAKLDPSAQERVMLWTDAIELFHENPVFGTGFLTYGNMNRVGSYRDTHNFYLKMLVETGVIGVFLFLFQLFLFGREGFLLFMRSKDPFLSLLGLGFVSLMLCAAIVNVFGDRWMFIQVDSNLWILLSCVLVAASIRQSDPSLENHTSVRLAPSTRRMPDGDYFAPKPIASSRVATQMLKLGRRLYLPEKEELTCSR